MVDSHDIPKGLRIVLEEQGVGMSASQIREVLGNFQTSNMKNQQLNMYLRVMVISFTCYQSTIVNITL